MGLGIVLLWMGLFGGSLRVLVAVVCCLVVIEFGFGGFG